MYEKILVPLDGSKRAEMIRPHVRELAIRFKATVILIMVVEPSYADGIAETYISISEKVFRARMRDCELYLEGIAARLKDKGVACKTIVAHILRQCCRRHFKPGRSPTFYRPVPVG